MTWTPQIGPQCEAILATWCQELLYGGDRGGGKSDYLLGDFAQDVSTYGGDWRGILFRKTYPELEEAIQRAKEIFVSAEFKVQKSTFVFPNGATLKMRPLEREQDADKYQGHQYTWIGFDELGNWTSSYAFKKLRACLRSSKLIPVKRIRCSANPGGPGHHWVKEMFIDPAPLGMQPIYDNDMACWRMFVPSKITDNHILLKNDPQYIARLQGVGSPQLVRAWLDGDWNVVAGAYFTEFSTHKHVISPFPIPDYWLKFRSLDWGFSRPFSVGWYAVSDGERYPKGAIIKYREWYGKTEANVGLRLTVDQVAQGINQRSRDEKYAYSVADPAIFHQDGGPAISETFRRNNLYFNPADNKRIPGWMQLRSRFVGEDDQPMLYFFSTCVDTIRTLPILQHDERHPEDLDTEGEDHAADETRYAVMSRPWTKTKAAEVPRFRALKEITFNDLITSNASLSNRVNRI